MYHRRKLLLALLEIFGGKLGAVDFYKLMFLFCQTTGQNHYDFYPHKYGAYSFTLDQDKEKLIGLGYLERSDKFHITSKGHFLNRLDTKTQLELQNLVNNIGTLRGESLLRKVYIEYPHHAINSEVARQILTPTEYQIILSCRNTTNEASLFTIGYEGISIDLYIDKLIDNNIKVLVDVRKNPFSHKYGFSKNQLKALMQTIGIDYIHLPQLGIPSDMRQDLSSDQKYKQLFEIYSKDMLPTQTDTLQELRNLIYSKKRVALTCFEAVYTCCHRSKIAEYFENDVTFDIPIKHL